MAAKIWEKDSEAVKVATWSVYLYVLYVKAFIDVMYSSIHYSSDV